MRKTLIILATLGAMGFATLNAQAAGSRTTCYGYGNSVSCSTYYY